MPVAPVPQASSMINHLRQVTLDWFSWLNSVRDGVNRVNGLVLSGEDTPENAVVASVGTIFLRSNGGANTTLYVKESGTNTDTGWVAK